MYRPEGWENPFLNILYNVTGGTGVGGRFGNICKGASDTFEAGADAMLEALMKTAWKCDDEQSFIRTQWNRATSASGSDKELKWREYPNPKGYLVFIPEEKE